ncbi:MAG: hypothetical protein U0469_02950 [Candidatus Paceibacterota bacterium]
MLNKKTQQIIDRENEHLPLSGNLYEKNQRRISLSRSFKVMFLSIVSGLVVVIVIFGYINSAKTKAESVTQENVISQLSKQISLPNEAPVTFLRVSDAKNLSLQDEFYKNVQNGDYIIVYSSMALVYDFSNNKIENVKTIR